MNEKERDYDKVFEKHGNWCESGDYGIDRMRKWGKGGGNHSKAGRSKSRYDCSSNKRKRDKRRPVWITDRKDSRGNRGGRKENI